MRWPWERRAEEPARAEAAAPTPAAPAPPAPSPSGWAFHPPLQRTIAPLPAIHEGTAAGWTATARDIGFTGRMSHLVSASSWSGVVDGDGGGLVLAARPASGGLPSAGPAPTTVPTGGTVAGSLTRAATPPGVPVAQYAPVPGPLRPPPAAEKPPVQRWEGTGIEADPAEEPPADWTNPDVAPGDGTVVEIPLGAGRPLEAAPVQRSDGDTTPSVTPTRTRPTGPSVQRSGGRRLGLGAPLGTAPAMPVRRPAGGPSSTGGGGERGAVPRPAAPADGGGPPDVSSHGSAAGSVASEETVERPDQGAAGGDASQPQALQRAVERPEAAAPPGGDGEAGPVTAPHAALEPPPSPPAGDQPDADSTTEVVGTLGAPELAGGRAPGEDAGGSGPPAGTGPAAPPLPVSRAAGVPPTVSRTAAPGAQPGAGSRLPAAPPDASGAASAALPTAARPMTPEPPPSASTSAAAPLLSGSGSTPSPATPPTVGRAASAAASPSVATPAVSRASGTAGTSAGAALQRARTDGARQSASAPDTAPPDHAGSAPVGSQAPTVAPSEDLRSTGLLGEAPNARDGASAAPSTDAVAQRGAASMPVAPVPRAHDAATEIPTSVATSHPDTDAGTPPALQRAEASVATSHPDMEAGTPPALQPAAAAVDPSPAVATPDVPAAEDRAARGDVAAPTSFETGTGPALHPTLAEPAGRAGGADVPTIGSRPDLAPSGQPGRRGSSPSLVVALAVTAGDAGVSLPWRTPERRVGDPRPDWSVPLAAQRSAATGTLAARTRVPLPGVPPAPANAPGAPVLGSATTGSRASGDGPAASRSGPSVTGAAPPAGAAGAAPRPPSLPIVARTVDGSADVSATGGSSAVRPVDDAPVARSVDTLSVSRAVGTLSGDGGVIPSPTRETVGTPSADRSVGPLAVVRAAGTPFGDWAGGPPFGDRAGGPRSVSRAVATSVEAAAPGRPRAGNAVGTPFARAAVGSSSAGRLATEALGSLPGGGSLSALGSSTGMAASGAVRLVARATGPVRAGPGASDGPVVQGEFIPAQVSDRTRRRRPLGDHRRTAPALPRPTEAVAEPAPAVVPEPAEEPADAADGVVTYVTPAQAAAAPAASALPAPQDLAALADALFPPLLRRMRHEILLDRERRGLRTDRRWP